MKSTLRQILPMITIMSATATIVVLVMNLTDFFVSKVTWVVLGTLFGVLISSFLTYFLRTLTKNPIPLKVAMVGQPAAGKTVFLSVLFRELELIDSGAISFQPYGRETIEVVAQHMMVLSKGRWLPPTAPNAMFSFRAIAKVSGGLFPRRFTVEVGDYAGEHVDEFDTASEMWLHRTDYFKYVVSSDIVFLIVDAQVLATRDIATIEMMQQRLIAALQVLIDDKGIPAGTPLRIPVALLVLKADLLPGCDMDEEEVRTLLAKLIRLCDLRCRIFSVELVSSVGCVQKDDSPPEKLSPMNVTEPMIQALRRVDTS